MRPSRVLHRDPPYDARRQILRSLDRLTAAVGDSDQPDVGRGRIGVDRTTEEARRADVVHEAINQRTDVAHPTSPPLVRWLSPEATCGRHYHRPGRPVGSAFVDADVNFYLQAIISVLVITDPVTRGIFFKTLTENEPERRRAYIRTITITVAIVLGVAALAGREILDALGIDLGAFGIAGGLVVALMGFEMLFGGEPSRAQGGKEAHEEPESFEGSVIVPYAIPFIAGPGAITLVITIAASTGNGEGTLAALIAVAVAARPVADRPPAHLGTGRSLRASDPDRNQVRRPADHDDRNPADAERDRHVLRDHLSPAAAGFLRRRAGGAGARSASRSAPPNRSRRGGTARSSR